MNINDNLIEKYLIYRKFDLIEQILKHDESSYKNIRNNILQNIINDKDYKTILNLLKLLNDEGKRYILGNNEVNILYNIIGSKIEYIEEILKYDKYIEWKNQIYILEIFLSKYYKKSYKKVKKIFNFLLKNKLDLGSIILNACLKGYNKYIIKKLYKKDNKIINISKNHTIPIVETYNNKKLFKFLLNHKADYNFIEFDNNILLNCIINNKQKKILRLLNISDIDVNIFNSSRNKPGHLIFLYNISYEIRYKILDKTDDLNFQNIKGNTILHYLFYYDDWKRYINILKNKNIDIYIKNNDNWNILDILKYKLDKYLYKSELNMLMNIVAISCINNIIYNDTLIKIYKKDNNYNLYKYILKFETNKQKENIDKIKLKIKKLKVSNIKLNLNINLVKINTPKNKIYIYTQRVIDIYIYLLYYMKKYHFSIALNESNKENFILNYDIENNNLIFSEKIKFSKKRIIFFLVRIINNNTYHSILIDNKKKIIIYFKPFFIHDNLTEILKIYMNDLFKDYIFIDSFELQSHNIYLIDYYDDIIHGEIIYNSKDMNINNYNVIWNFWFLELYMMNLSLNPLILMKETINKIIKEYKTLIYYIRKYSEPLIHFMILIFKKNNIHKNSIFKINLTNHDTDKIYNSIEENFLNF
jgi:hypothetical protein